jgi:hypothetical protein
MKRHSKAMKEEMCYEGYNGYSGKGKGWMGCGYFLGFIGALWFYISTATSFWAGVFGVVKAAVWPAILVYKLFNFLI